VTDPAADLTLFLGGVRAGKSAAAIRLAGSLTAKRGTLFVATAEARDDEMRRRIAAHRLERPPMWETLESPIQLAEDLERCLGVNPSRFDVVVIDCVTLWVSNILLSLPDESDAEGLLAARVAALLQTIERFAHLDAPGGGRSVRRWIVVSNEVGLGVIPATTLGRQFGDALGRTNQSLAAAAREVILMVAGIPLPVKVRG
jgi:adenosylcobinamide kinase / adenosylcobinamide-phosphate guanylyltransferase